MVLNAIATIVAGFVLISVIAMVVRLVGGGSFATLASQQVVLGATAYLLLTTSFVALPAAVTLAAMPLGLRIFTLLWFYYQGKKVLQGDYGQETRWAAELAEAEDKEFMMAVSKLNELEMREVGIAAESKEELREKTIERAKEEQ